jgi:hypothetical protein
MDEKEDAAIYKVVVNRDHQVPGNHPQCSGTPRQSPSPIA